MEEFLDLLRVKINEISAFINKLQTVIGLSTSTDTSIYGKLNTLESKMNSLMVPKYYTEKLEINGNNFLTTYTPLNSVCMYDEVTLYHPDGSTLIWEGVKFFGNRGVLDGATNEYNGWNVKIQYFYI